MKNSKKVVTTCFLLLSFVLHAGWPVSSPFGLNSGAGTGSLNHGTSGTFVTVQKKRIPEQRSFASDRFRRERLAEHYGFTFLDQLQPVFVTGHAKKEETSVVRILNWDFKIKFKLNRNMNIIFSYN